MHRFKDRVNRKLNVFGTTLIRNGSSSFKAFMQEMNGTTVNMYLTPDESALIVKPAYLLVTGADTVISAGDIVMLDNREMTVHKVLNKRLADQVVFKEAVLF